MKMLNYINGALVAPVSGDYLDNTDPSTGEVYSYVPDSDERDVQLAHEAAKAAFPAWSTMAKSKRSAIMMKVSDLLLKNLDRFAKAESQDNGKPVWLAESVDIPRAASNFEFYATAILHDSAETHEMENVALNYTLRQPLGVVGCISPWNLPLYLFSWKIAPALASGNCVIAKPSEVTPMTAFLLSEICMEAGMPAGVLNIVHGLGPKVGEAMIIHPDIPAISFTGGTETGKHIARQAAPMFKKLSLELGGKNPNLIFADCDFEKMIKTTLRSSFANQGEICLCGSRILVEESIYDQFKTRFVEEVKKMKIGHPSGDVNLGAIVSKGHIEKIQGYIELAKEEGGTILCGGNRVFPEGYENGYYLEPTVIEGLDYNCRTNQEEIFGPVVTIMPFKTDEEALMYANSTKFGLASTVWTSNLNRAHTMASQLHTGIVWINTWLLRDLRTPFGGVKQSGVGREGGFEALRFFTEPKNVCIKF